MGYVYDLDGVIFFERAKLGYTAGVFPQTSEILLLQWFSMVV